MRGKIFILKLFKALKILKMLKKILTNLSSKGPIIFPVEKD